MGHTAGQGQHPGPGSHGGRVLLCVCVGALCWATRAVERRPWSLCSGGIAPLLLRPAPQLGHLVSLDPAPYLQEGDLPCVDGCLRWTTAFGDRSGDFEGLGGDRGLSSCCQGSRCRVLLRLPLRNHVTTHAYLWGDSPGTQSVPMALVLHTVTLVMSGRPHRPPALKGPWDECGGPVSTEHALQDRRCPCFPHLGLAIQWPKGSDSFTFPPSPFGAFTQEGTERRGAWGCCAGGPSPSYGHAPMEKQVILLMLVPAGPFPVALYVSQVPPADVYRKVVFPIGCYLARGACGRPRCRGQPNVPPMS